MINFFIVVSLVRLKFIRKENYYYANKFILVWFFLVQMSLASPLGRLLVVEFDFPNYLFLQKGLFEIFLLLR